LKGLKERINASILDLIGSGIGEERQPRSTGEVSRV